ncbi:alpha/beta hydrolase [Nostoc sp. CHAB 5844]|nr:alpha/beta hydrolase [Nostoc sp. CHAB 5844]
MTCRTGQWPVTSAAASVLAPARGTPPTLMLSGELDTATRRRFAREVARTLTKAYLIDFPGLAQSLIEDSACARRISIAFMGNPRGRPDAGCALGAGEYKLQTHFC